MRGYLKNESYLIFTFLTGGDTVADAKTHQVLIVGAGPAGQLSALLLARQNISSRLIDRRKAISTAPKAHAVNARTLEICQSIGVDAAAIRAAGASANGGGWVRFMGTLSGPQFGVLPFERQDDAAFDSTPFPLTNIPQPKFEATLEKHVKAEPLISFSREVTCKQLDDEGDHVRATLFDQVANITTQEDYQYVIAADGAGSKIRSSLGISMEGPEVLENFITIHFEADLRHLTGTRPGLLYFLLDPTAQGVLIGYDRAKTWVLMHGFDPAVEPVDAYTPQRCQTLVNKALGTELPDLRICNVSHWAMSAQIAETYGKGRIFLVGDAAHRFPPTGGLGLNTGAGDAQNLAWKLAAVLKGQAGAELLESYEAERRPVAQINSDQSLTNAAKIFDMFALLHGLEPANVNEHYAALASNPDDIAGLADVVQAQRPHFDSFNLQLGYRYASDAVMDAKPLASSADIETSQYTPSWDAGAHVPHRWVRQDDEKKSLLDLLPIDQFSLLLGPDADPLPELALGPDMPPVTQLKLGQDYEDNALNWQAQTQLPNSGALLVRPDGHIAARIHDSENMKPDTIAQTLRSVLALS